MSRRARNGVVAVLAFLVLAAAERAVVHQLQVGGVRPDPLLVASVWYGFMRGVPGGVAVGFGTGMARDILGGRYVGLSALTRGLMGAGAGLLRRRVYGNHLLVLPVLTFAASALTDMVFLLVLGASDAQIFRRLILPAALYNAMLALCLHSVYWMLGRRWQVQTGRPAAVGSEVRPSWRK